MHDPTDRRITIQEPLGPLSLPAGSFIRPGVIQGANVAYGLCWIGLIPEKWTVEKCSSAQVKGAEGNEEKSVQ